LFSDTAFLSLVSRRKHSQNFSGVYLFISLFGRIGSFSVKQEFRE